MSKEIGMLNWLKKLFRPHVEECPKLALLKGLTYLKHDAASCNCQLVVKEIEILIADLLEETPSLKDSKESVDKAMKNAQAYINSFSTPHRSTK
jgi:hypothetical protein